VVEATGGRELKARAVDHAWLKGFDDRGGTHRHEDLVDHARAVYGHHERGAPHRGEQSEKRQLLRRVRVRVRVRLSVRVWVVGVRVRVRVIRVRVIRIRVGVRDRDRVIRISVRVRSSGMSALASSKPRARSSATTAASLTISREPRRWSKTASG